MNPMRWMAIKLGGQPWLPRFAKVIVGTDKLLQRLTRGRVDLLTFAGLPEILLQVPGRKSGCSARPRCCACRTATAG